MSKHNHVVVALSLSCLAAVSYAAATEKADPGKREYRDKCAVCHGMSGKGDGGGIDVLKTAPADLTLLSKRNGGVFPVERVAAIIDGRQAVKGHGTQDMPIWGREYLKETVKADEYFGPMPYDMEMYVRSRILALIDYLNRIQAK